MRFMFRSDTASDRPLPNLGLLVLATGLVITLQNPDAVDSASRLLSELDLPSPARVMEWRPDSPPPWVDGDQLMVDEAEELPTVATTSRDAASSVDLRARPER
jgi:hypothetical protein